MVMDDIMGNVSDMGRPSTFTKDQMVNVVLWWGELKIMLKVRWKFAKHFGINSHPRKEAPKLIFNIVKCALPYLSTLTH